jgi:hypothetical protein
MPFPISIRGTVRIPIDGVDPTRVATVTRRVAAMLDTAGASIATQNDNTIAFRTRYFSGFGSRSVVVQLSSGSIEIDADSRELRLIYQASTVRMLVIVTAISCVAATFLLSMAQNSPAVDDLPVWFPVAAFAIAWLWLFGGNYLMAKIRLGRWLEQGVRKLLFG